MISNTREIKKRWIQGKHLYSSNIFQGRNWFYGITLTYCCCDDFAMMTEGCEKRGILHARMTDTTRLKHALSWTDQRNGLSYCCNIRKTYEKYCKLMLKKSFYEFLIKPFPGRFHSFCWIISILLLLLWHFK